MTPQLRAAVLEAGADEVLAVREVLLEAGRNARSDRDVACAIYEALGAVLGGDPGPLLTSAVLQVETARRGTTFAVLEELNNAQLDYPDAVLPGALAHELAFAVLEVGTVMQQAEAELDGLDGLPEDWS